VAGRLRIGRDLGLGLLRESPSIKVNYEMIDYETIQDKFTTSVSSGNAPDVVTLDMTWIPTYAASDMLADLSDLSGNQINGQPIDKPPAL
jgi:ABC-type glycerol-3-phosphate transport system substrate-binding protein